MLNIILLNKVKQKNVQKLKINNNMNKIPIPVLPSWSVQNWLPSEYSKQYLVLKFEKRLKKKLSN